MTRSIISTLLLIVISTFIYAQGVHTENLRCEYKIDPVGIDQRVPHLSWEIGSESRGTMQTAYQIIVSDNLSLIQQSKGNVWDSKKTRSQASIQIKYAGRPLESAKTYYWKVRVWDNKGRASGWSKSASWVTGLFAARDWKGAQWIAYEKMPDSAIIVPALHGKGPKSLNKDLKSKSLSEILPGEKSKKRRESTEENDVLPLIRKSISVRGPLKKATAFICGLGHFEMSLNGLKVGDHELDPGWTKYDREAQYVSFDLTSKLRTGKNALGVTLGNGFYYLPRDKRYRKLTGAYGYPKLIFMLKLEYKNGGVEHIVSDKTWKASAGPITYSSVYGGEDYDARLERSGWNTRNYDDRDWSNVVVVDGPARLYAQLQEPIRILDQFKPVKISKVGKGSYVYDMGQNASVIPYIEVQGKSGDTVRITPGELLDEQGLVSQKATGKPAYYTYVLKGGEKETWRPRFTYYGCRYMQIDGAVPADSAKEDALPVLSDFRNLHLRNSAPTVGMFSSSSELFNKTNTLIDWAERSNMMSIFTDCPHRERLGWLEQIHLVGNSIQYNYDIYNLCRKAMRDMRTAQTDKGLIPATVPEYTIMEFADGVFRDSPEWGSTGVIMPWYLYHWYGDKDFLAENYDVMKRYVNYLGGKANNYIVSYGLSDWYDVGPQRSGFSQLTPMGITATAYYYYDLIIMNKVALLLGKTADAAEFNTLAARVKDAYNAKFFNKEKAQYGTGSQAANAISVYMELVPDGYRDQVIENIVKDVRARNNSLTAGDIGFRYLVQVLAEAGYSDVIYDMNSNPDVPGYGYQLAKGATALTESWVASREVSNNHFMLGHLQEWLYGDLAGLRPAPNSVAFQKVLIKPEPVGNIDSARVRYHSPYGVVASAWKKSAEGFVLDVSVPANSSAIISLPAGEQSKISEGGLPVSGNKDIKVLPFSKGRAGLEIGSGRYRFVVKD